MAKKNLYEAQIRQCKQLLYTCIRYLRHGGSKRPYTWFSRNVSLGLTWVVERWASKRSTCCIPACHISIADSFSWCKNAHVWHVHTISTILRPAYIYRLIRRRLICRAKIVIHVWGIVYDSRRLSPTSFKILIASREKHEESWYVSTLTTSCRFCRD